MSETNNQDLSSVAEGERSPHYFERKTECPHILSVT